MKRTPLETYANLLAFLHFVCTLFFWGGTVAVIFYHPYAPIQAWALVVAFMFKIPLNNNCILTIIEERLRGTNQADHVGRGSFIATYINKVFGTKLTARQAKTFFLLTYILSCILTIYALVNP